MNKPTSHTPPHPVPAPVRYGCTAQLCRQGRAARVAIRILKPVELEDGEYVVYQEQTVEQEAEGELRVIFQDGHLLDPTSLSEIRNRLWPEFMGS